MPDFSFPKSAKLRKSAEFRHIYDGQVRAGDDHLLVFASWNVLGETRCGLSVSKKHGNAVCKKMNNESAVPLPGRNPFECSGAISSYTCVSLLLRMIW